MPDWKDVRRYGEIMEDERIEDDNGCRRKTKYWFDDKFIVLEMCNGKCSNIYEVES